MVQNWTPQPGKWVCLSHDIKKTRLARVVSPLSYAERQFRLPILWQPENYTWKRRKEASQKKGHFADGAISCVTTPVTRRNATT